MAAIWYREDSQMRTSRYLHNGQPLGRTTTIVPRGIFFRKDQFVDAAVHALGQKNHLRNALGLSYESRDLAAMAAYTEAYNGFGYRMAGDRALRDRRNGQVRSWVCTYARRRL